MRPETISIAVIFHKKEISGTTTGRSADIPVGVAGHVYTTEWIDSDSGYDVLSRGRLASELSRPNGAPVLVALDNENFGAASDRVAHHAGDIKIPDCIRCSHAR